MTKPKEKISDQLAAGRFVFLQPKERNEVPTFGEMLPSVTNLDIVIEERGDPKERFRPRYMTLANTPKPWIVRTQDARVAVSCSWRMDPETQWLIARMSFMRHRCRGLTRQRPRPVQCTHRFTVAGEIGYRQTE